MPPESAALEEVAPDEVAPVATTQSVDVQAVPPAEHAAQEAAVQTAGSPDAAAPPADSTDALEERVDHEHQPRHAASTHDAVPVEDRVSQADHATAAADAVLAAASAADTGRQNTLPGQARPATPSHRGSAVGAAWRRPPQTRVVTIANQKGGVGKTTTTVNLAAALAQGGLDVLVIDTDPQGNASTALGIDHHAEVPSIYDVLVDEATLADVAQDCPDIAGLRCVPATIDLAGAEIELVSFVARETRLQRAINAFLQTRLAAGESVPDYILIDCPPSLGLLTINAFVAASEVLIPIQCEYYALEGLSMLLKNIEMIRRHLNPHLHVSTILLTMYDARTRLSQQVAEEVRTHFPEQVLRATVPRSVRISEAPSHGQTVLTYDPMSSGALSYLDAAEELCERS